MGFLESEDLTSDYITEEELRYLENNYKSRSLQDSEEAINHEFLYAWGLTRTRDPARLKLGVSMLQDIMGRQPEKTRDCLYYGALGMIRLAKYKEAKKYIDQLLMMEPENIQALEVQSLLERHRQSDTLLGFALVGGVVAFTGAVLWGALRRRD